MLLEPWFRGSHRQWAEGWARHSRHRVHIVAGTDQGWRRGLLTHPAEFARRLEQRAGAIDCVVASTPIDLATTVGLARHVLNDVPIVLYMHESQAAYPTGPRGGRPASAIVADWTAMMTADRVYVASEHHRQALGEGQWPALTEVVDLDASDAGRVADLVSTVQTLPVGVDIPPPRDRDVDGPLRILWNHRWAHDKAPERFVHAMNVLAGEGFDFEIIAAGAVERGGRAALERLVRTLGSRVVARAPLDQEGYRAALRLGDVVVSTARHDFFGVAVAEAIAAGARPVLPRRLSYPELIPDALADELLYRGQLDDALRPLLDRPRSQLHEHRAALCAHLQQFAWATMAPRYDQVVDELICSR